MKMIKQLLTLIRDWKHRRRSDRQIQDSNWRREIDMLYRAKYGHGSEPFGEE